MVNQNKIFSFKIKRQAENVFPSDVERTVEKYSRLITLYPLKSPSDTNKQSNNEMSNKIKIATAGINYFSYLYDTLFIKKPSRLLE